MASIAEILLEQGRQAAEARRQQGAQSAQMWSGLGNTLASALTTYAQQKQEAPILAQNAKIRDLQLSNAQAEADARTADVNARKQFDQALKDSMVTDPETGLTTYDRQKAQQLVTSGNLAHMWPELSKILDASDQADRAVRQSHMDAIKTSAELVDRLGNDPTVFENEIQRGIKNGRFTQQEAAPYLEAAQRDPAHISAITGSILGKKPEYMAVNPGQSVIDKNSPSGGAVFTAPEKVTPKPDYTINGQRFSGETNKPLGPAVPAQSTSGPGAQNDVADAVAAMKAGTVPPILPGRASKDYVALLAEAKRQNYDLAGAATDWMATQKHIASMNGQQQLRLNQSINALPDLLDSVDALASKWKGGRFPVLNKANVAAAKNGAYGKEVASIATQLDSQIADVVADLGTVYMGGNTPTDHSLGLAAKSLNGEWDERVLHDMVKLAKSNVDIRRNSINNTGVAGASDANPYVTQPVPSHEPMKPPPTIPEGVVITRGR